VTWTQATVEQFEREVSNRANLVDPDGEQDWFSLTFGWAIAKGYDIYVAHDFAHHIRYNTELG
jgi:hypothetical protein